MVPTDSSSIRSVCEIIEAASRADYYSCLDREGSERLGVQIRASHCSTLTLATRGTSPFFNRVLALGVRAECGAEEIDRIESLLENAGAKSAMIGLSPYARPEGLIDALRDRGYAEGPVWAKLARGPQEPQKAETDLEIIEIGPGHRHAEAFHHILISCFGMDPAYAPLMQAVVGKPSWRCYLALNGNAPIAAAGMYLSAIGAWLGFMATLPEARGRGAQSALIERRLRDGIDCGCPVFVGETALDRPEAPNPSYHNLIRMGFEHIYDRPHFIWTNPES